VVTTSSVISHRVSAEALLKVPTRAQAYDEQIAFTYRAQAYATLALCDAVGAVERELDGIRKILVDLNEVIANGVRRA
jgi:hypothetical protein